MQAGSLKQQSSSCTQTYTLNRSKPQLREEGGYELGSLTGPSGERT